MKKKNIFLVVALAFTLLMVLLAWHMFSITAKPWDKQKNDVPGKYRIK